MEKTMQVVEENLKGFEGEIKLIPENLDDLWHLKFIIEKGDKVFAITKRSSHSDDKLRSDKELVTLKIGVEVEKVEFHKFANRLRVSGKIVSGIEESGYHTLNISVGKEVSIVKKSWKKEQLERIKYAVKKRPEVLILTIEEGEAVAGYLRDWGVEEVFDVVFSYSKDHDSRKEFFGEVFSKLKSTNFRFLIIAGPGFTKKDFLDFLKQKDPEKASKAILVDTSSIGLRGFTEVLRRKVVERIVGKIRLEEEAEYIEELMERIVKDDRAVYGIEEVKKAQSFGAIEVLLVVDEFLMMEREKWDIDNFLKEVEDVGGKILVMSSEFEPGKRLKSFGGIAALLRFNV
ncbi:MAG: mRNA surveillance protein pelota [Archaeoglobaceae archaeon]|nr:mRNA surveillance protein pelota [Archaeoglobaceae archaeon]MCX8151714.1 mRNA surveillance protein pelota [Archaeoglobaceae archaeon]MDW8013843.1 mRNA surveillance protein pelota [Archaeoglobaceae archaeon]